MNTTEKTNSQELLTTAGLPIKIGIIGLGNIGFSMAHGLLKSGFLTKNQLYLSNGELARTLAKSGSIFENEDSVALVDNQKVISECDIIFMAIKPWQIADELGSWKRFGNLKSHQMVVSFAAGIKIDTIKYLIGKNQPIARVMPNLAVGIGRGVLGWTVSDSVTRGQMKILSRLLDSIGMQHFVENDNGIDEVTSLSGSGPSYVYRLAIEMIEVAKNWGWSEEMALLSVRETIIGAALFWEAHPEITSEDLIKMIATKGGTTEAAMLSFSQNQFSQIVSNALNMAKYRGSAIGEEYFKQAKMSQQI